MITWPVLADAVRECATRPAGALHVTGRPGGLIRLRAGAVVGTWTSGTPLAVPSPDPATRSVAASASPLARLAMTDAVFVMAAGRITGWRAEDDPSGAAEGISMELEVLLTEVDRRMRRVTGPDGLLSPEETVVRRRRDPDEGPLAVTPDERRLLDSLAASGEAVRTVRDLAFAARRGVFAVLLDVQRLAAMGAVALTTHPLADEPPPVQALLVQARSTLDPPAVAAVSAALQRRRLQLADSAPPAPAPSAPSEPGASATRATSATLAAPDAPDAPNTPAVPDAPAAGGPTDPPHLRAVPGGLAQRVPGATNAVRARRLPWQPRRAAAHQAPEHAAPEHAASEHPMPEHVARAKAALDRAASDRFGIDLPAQSRPAHERPDHKAPAGHRPVHEPPGHARPSHSAPDHRGPDHPERARADRAHADRAQLDHPGPDHPGPDFPAPDRPVRDRMEGRP